MVRMKLPHMGCKQSNEQFKQTVLCFLSTPRARNELCCFQLETRRESGEQDINIGTGIEVNIHNLLKM